MDCRCQRICIRPREVHSRSHTGEDTGLSRHVAFCTAHHLPVPHSRRPYEVLDLSSLEYCTIAGEALNPLYSRDLQEKLTGIVDGGFRTDRNDPHRCHHAVDGTETRQRWDCPILQYDVDLIDHEGRSVEAGEQGQIVIRTDKGKPLGLFKEYYRDANRTHEAWNNGIYYTGDVAWKDEDGYLWFVGSRRRRYQSSGYRIGPFEVESALMTHPAVVECAITGAR